MRRALHLGVHKALGVVASHYRVNLRAISTGYVIPEAINVLAEAFMENLFPGAPPAGDLEP
jgi:hypothetical protein